MQKKDICLSLATVVVSKQLSNFVMNDFDKLPKEDSKQLI